MKIAAIMATRGNPRKAAAVIECANSLASGLHEIQWIVGADNDDIATIDYMAEHSPDVRVMTGQAPIGVGSVWNRCAALTDADIIAPFPDDSFPGMPDWDATICENLQEPGRLGVIAWNDTANPGQCTLPVVTRRWFDWFGLYDERFPYWFYDTCVAEMWTFVRGRPVPIPATLLLAAKKGKTQSMRELAFWWSFYVFTRRERLAKAKEIRALLGLPMAPDLLQNIVESWEMRDASAAKYFSETEKALSAATGEPSQRYVTAKARAVAIMQEAA